MIESFPSTIRYTSSLISLATSFVSIDIKVSLFMWIAPSQCQLADKEEAEEIENQGEVDHTVWTKETLNQTEETERYWKGRIRMFLLKNFIYQFGKNKHRVNSIAGRWFCAGSEWVVHFHYPAHHYWVLLTSVLHASIKWWYLIHMCFHSITSIQDMILTYIQILLHRALKWQLYVGS